MVRFLKGLRSNLLNKEPRTVLYRPVLDILFGLIRLPFSMFADFLHRSQNDFYSSLDFSLKHRQNPPKDIQYAQT